MTRRNEEGFILVAVLWMLAALSALASTYAFYALETAPSASLPEERLRAEAAIRSGVELCAFRQLAWPKTGRPDAGEFSTYVGAIRIDVVYRSENARLDLNAAPKEALAGLFVQLGAPSATAEFLTSRIVAWRSRLSDNERLQEAAIYAKAGLNYGPPGAPFDNALEMALLPGMSPNFAQRALPYLTIFNAGGKIDPLVADPLVLAGLPGATGPLVKNFLLARNGPRPDAATFARIAGPVKDFVSADPNDVVRTEIVATLVDRRIHAEVVLKVNDKAPAPYDILYWRDDFDGEGG